MHHEVLRRHYQCADCKRARKESGSELPVPSHVRIDEIRPVGQYAVQLVFSDGHELGIFPWRFLQELESGFV